MTVKPYLCVDKSNQRVLTGAIGSSKLRALGRIQSEALYSYFKYEATEGKEKSWVDGVIKGGANQYKGNINFPDFIKGLQNKKAEPNALEEMISIVRNFWQGMSQGRLEGEFDSFMTKEVDPEMIQEFREKYAEDMQAIRNLTEIMVLLPWWHPIKEGVKKIVYEKLGFQENSEENSWVNLEKALSKLNPNELESIKSEAREQLVLDLTKSKIVRGFFVWWDEKQKQISSIYTQKSPNGMIGLYPPRFSNEGENGAVRSDEENKAVRQITRSTFLPDEADLEIDSEELSNNGMTASGCQELISVLKKMCSLGKYEEAYGKIIKALQSNPNNPDYLNSKAIILSKIPGREKEGLSLGREALEIVPHNTKIKQLIRTLEGEMNPAKPVLRKKTQ
ncbi:MAG: hypothetical protein SFT81_07100 [Candidatus Caenarcaniphilales bacterium]|nr:hypothetical protein [Candidatus Caenarcaniphilales bacterium]